VANLVKAVARDDEFHDAVEIFKVREKGRITVRFKLQVGASCSVSNKTLCRIKRIYYMHSNVYIILAKIEHPKFWVLFNLWQHVNFMQM